MEFNSRFWLRMALVNLLIVALLGLLMRYKIGFEFPVFNQKYIQFSHYHFAFYAWIGHALMVLLVQSVARVNFDFKMSNYNRIFFVNAVASYGMLVSFLGFGFGAASIAFLLMAIASGYWFTIAYVRTLRRYRINPIAANWFRAALFFNFLSTLGVFALAYMMLKGHMHQKEYLATSYYFLHFQYNGWFFFACMGLLADFIDGTARVHKEVFRWFFISCIPAYFLSALWLELPVWVYVLVVASALAQTYAWALQILALIKTKPSALYWLPYILRYVLLFVGVACSIKIVLQLGSTIPEISKLAFGFRPIVIAYLHLVLLAVISLFILFFVYANRLLSARKGILWSLLIFSIGILLNECVLAAQGIGAFSYTVIPFANEMLFIVSVVMVLGIGSLAFLSIIPEKNRDYDINHTLRP